jgi:TM2 domain-containing membrane protein YozV
MLGISGTARLVITFIQTGVIYLSAAWLSMIGTSLLSEAIVVSEHLRQRGLDSQIIRLASALPVLRLPSDR